MAQTYTDGKSTYIKNDDDTITKIREDGTRVDLAKNDPRMQYIPEIAGGTFTNPTAAQLMQDGENKYYTIGNHTYDENSYKMLLDGKISASGGGVGGGSYAPTYAGNASLINSQYDQQLAAKLASLKSAREKAQSTLTSQIPQINQSAQANRNQAYGIKTQSGNRLREVLAAQGNRGGKPISAMANLESAYQGNVASINTSETNALNGINTNIANLYNTEDETAITAEVEAARAKALQEDAYQQEQNRQWQASFNQSQEESAASLKAADLERQLNELKIRDYDKKDPLAAQEAQLKLDLLRAQIGSTNRSNTGSSNPTQSEVKNYVISSALSAMRNAGDTQAQNDWLYKHKAEIIANGGTEAYDYLFNELYPGAKLYNKVQEEQALSGY